MILTWKHVLVLSCVIIANTPSVLAQPVPDADVKFSVPAVMLVPHRLEKVEANGTVRIHKIPGSHQPPAPSEGYYLLIKGHATGNDGASDVLRAEVTELTESYATLKVGPKAFASLANGDVSLQIVRPFTGLARLGGDTSMFRQATTAEMKALPDLLAVTPTWKTAGNPNLQAHYDAMRRGQSGEHVKKIVQAMHGYVELMGAFPAAVVLGPDGKPWHSWRVLILPWLGEIELYNAYNFAEPWDSPANKKLIDRMPDVYRDPFYQTPKTTDTNYAVVVGPKTIFRPNGLKMTDIQNPPEPGANSVGFRDITDGTSNTIAVVPVSPDRKIPWTKPEDINFTADFPGIGKPGGIAAPHLSRDGKVHLAIVGLADGSVIALSNESPPDLLVAALTINGGEITRWDKLDYSLISPPFRPKLKMLKITRSGQTFKAVVEE